MTSSSAPCIDLPIFEFTGRQPFQNVLIHGLIRVTSKDARCQNLLVTGLTQWMRGSIGMEKPSSRWFPFSSNGFALWARRALLLQKMDAS